MKIFWNLTGVVVTRLKFSELYTVKVIHFTLCEFVRNNNNKKMKNSVMKRKKDEINVSKCL